MSTPSKPMALPFTEAEIEKYRADVAESESVYIANEGHLSESYGTMIREYERWLATVDALRAEAQEQFNIRQAAQADYVKAADALEEVQDALEEAERKIEELREGHEEYREEFGRHVEVLQSEKLELQSLLDRIVKICVASPTSNISWTNEIAEIERIAMGEK